MELMNCEYTTPSFGKLTEELGEAAKRVVDAVAEYNRKRDAVVRILALDEQRVIDSAIPGQNDRIVQALAAAKRPMGVTELAQAIGAAPTNAFRVALCGLLKAGRVKREGRGVYSLP